MSISLQAELVLAPMAALFDPVRRIHDLCKASSSVDGKNVLEIQKVCEISKHVLACKFNELIAEADGAPMLSSKSADGTPLSTVVRSVGTLPSGKSFSRTGKETHEYLVKNQFARVILPNGAVRSAVLLQDPIKLAHGKTCIAIFEACRKDWKSLRQLGHRGLVIEHYGYDRLGIEATERLWFAAFRVIGCVA